MAGGKRPRGVKHTYERAEGAASGRELRHPEFDEILLADNLQAVEKIIDKAFEARRHSFVHELAARIEGAGLTGIAARPDNQDVGSWIQVESLSALRGLVGGRFHNLKKRWVDAGLPLREHRGDKVQSFEINKEGWVELTNWIVKQGYEVRLAPDQPDCLFELRAMPKD